MPRPEPVDQNLANRAAYHAPDLRDGADEALQHLARAEGALQTLARELAAFDKGAEEVTSRITETLGVEPTEINRAARHNRAGALIGRALSRALGVGHLGALQLTSPSGPPEAWAEKERATFDGIIASVEKLATQAA